MEKVLIIEDNAMMRMFLANYLSAEYEVLTVQSPQEGMELVREKNEGFALVISDYYAPGTPELEALNKMENSLRWQGTPLVILTDEDKSAQRITALECGASDCLSKPFNPRELSMRIKGLIKAEQKQIVYRPVA